MSNIDSMSISAGSTLGNYTEEEVKTAQKKAGICVQSLKQVGSQLFTAMELLYDFEQGRHYRAMRFKNVRQWLESEGFAPTTFFRYLAIYKSFTINNAIMVDTYKELDMKKILALKALADNHAERDELVDAIDQAGDLIMGDLIDITNNKVRRLKLGKGVEEEENEIKDPLEELEPGAYRIVKLTKEDHKDDPRFNRQDMVPVLKVSAKWFWNLETKQFTTVIK